MFLNARAVLRKISLSDTFNATLFSASNVVNLNIGKKKNEQNKVNTKRIFVKFILHY